MKKQSSHKPYLVKKLFADWRDQVVNWYNEWATNGFLAKKKNLYLYGEEDYTGMLEIVQFLLGIYWDKKN